MLRFLPDEKAFGCVAKYCAHLKHIEDLWCSLNQNVLADIQNCDTGPPSLKACEAYNRSISTTATVELIMIWLLTV